MSSTNNVFQAKPREISPVNIKTEEVFTSNKKKNTPLNPFGIDREAKTASVPIFEKIDSESKRGKSTDKLEESPFKVVAKADEPEAITAKAVTEESSGDKVDPFSDYSVEGLKFEEEKNADDVSPEKALLREAKSNGEPKVKKAPAKLVIPSVNMEAPAVEENSESSEDTSDNKKKQKTARVPLSALNLPSFSAKANPRLTPAPVKPTTALQMASSVDVPELQAGPPVNKAPVPPKKRKKSSGEPNQLALRALFGVDSDLSRQDILEHASKLQGIKHVDILPDDQMDVFDEFRLWISRLGFGETDTVQLQSTNPTIDFIELDGTILLVHRDGDYAAGVREQMMLVAREVGKLSE